MAMPAHFFIALSIGGPFALLVIAVVNSYRNPNEEC
jgi:hypothetical protein